MAGKPNTRTGLYKMTDEHRLKIANSNILSDLIECGEGKLEMSAVRAQVSLALMKKIMPDMTYNEHANPDGSAMTFTFTTIYEKKPDGND